MKTTAAIISISLLMNGCSLRPKETQAFLDPAFATLIPNDTTILAGASIERLVKAPVYEKYLKGIPLPGVEQFRARTGIDVEHKLWQVLWVSNGRDNFWLARGGFASEITTEDFQHTGVPTFAYKGNTLFGDERNAVTPFNSTTMGMGPTPALRRLLDQRSTIAAPPPRLQTLIAKIPHEPQIWAVWTGGRLDVQLPGNWANATRVLNSLESATFTMTLTDRVNAVISGQAVDDRAAEDVNGALATLLTLARSASKDIKSKAILQGIQVTKEGRQITLKLDGPPETLDLLLN